MKPVIWIAVALVVVGGGYMWYSGQKAPEQATQTPAASGNDETQPTATTESATETATEAVTEAVDEATEAASEAATEATEAVTEATEAVTEAATEATEAADEAATEATEAATESVTEATEAAADAASSTGDLTNLLTLDGFDMDKVVEAIDASDLSAAQKTTLTTGLQQAKDNPELLKGMLDQVKTALGL